MQVTVDYKRYAGIKSQIGRHIGVMIWVEGQPLLAHQDHHTHQYPDQIDGKHDHHMLLPVHFPFGINAADAVQKPVQGVKEKIHLCFFSGIYPGYVSAQGQGQ
ncbi:hypothetical protein D3C80_1367360 [compost metagenome]